MISYRSIFFINGAMVCCIAVAMLFPLSLHFFYLSNLQNYTSDFLTPFLITALIGFCLVIANRSDNKVVLGTREAFLVTTFAWLMCGVFASLPFHFSYPYLNWVDSLFESFSAITTTGSTVIKDIESCPKSILLWRSILQWLGGVGIVVMGMIVFPILQIGGMQLFRSEFSDRSEKAMPKVSQIAKAICIIYIFFSILCFFSLRFAGMGFFDSLCHCASIISTGGLSTKNMGLASFQSDYIQIVSSIFMLIGGSTLILYIKIIKGDFKNFFKDQQIVFYFLIIGILSFVLFLFLLFNNYGFKNSVIKSFSSVVASITTTSINSFGDLSWAGSFPILVLFFCSLIGGCTGSTTGGIKIFRLQVALSHLLLHLKQLRKPHGVFIDFYNGHKVTDNVLISVFNFIGLYLISIFILSILLSISGFDLLESFSNASGILSNTGTFLWENSKNSLANIGQSAKLIMIMGMIVGRLELLTVIIIFMPHFWKN